MAKHFIRNPIPRRNVTRARWVQTAKMDCRLKSQNLKTAGSCCAILTNVIGLGVGKICTDYCNVVMLFLYMTGVVYVCIKYRLCTWRGMRS